MWKKIEVKDDDGNREQRLNLKTNMKIRKNYVSQGQK